MHFRVKPRGILDLEMSLYAVPRKAKKNPKIVPSKAECPNMPKQAKARRRPPLLAFNSPPFLDVSPLLPSCFLPTTNPKKELPGGDKQLEGEVHSVESVLNCKQLICKPPWVLGSPIKWVCPLTDPPSPPPTPPNAPSANRQLAATHLAL